MNNIRLKTLERGTSIDSVLEILRNLIIAGDFPPGFQLKQSILAEELGVSQGPIREALSRLTEEGLVETIPFRGMFVKKLTLKDVEEIYQIRCSLEILACNLAFQKLRQPDIINMLEDLVSKTVNDAIKSDTEAAIEADLNFHRALVEFSGNSLLFKIWDSLLAQARTVLRKLYTLDHGSNMLTLALNHKALLAAVKSGDFNQVSIQFEEHFESARKALMSVMD